MKTFPKSEMFGSTSQIGLASGSVPANIVEGNHRSTLADCFRLLGNPLGSLAETVYLLNCSTRLGILDADTHNQLDERYKSRICMIKALINSHSLSS